MSLQQLQALAARERLNPADVSMMHANGLTLAAAEAAGRVGINLSQVLQLFQQFGPTFVVILTTLLPLIKVPTPPPPAPAPSDEPAHSHRRPRH